MSARISKGAGFDRGNACPRKQVADAEEGDAQLIEEGLKGKKTLAELFMEKKKNLAEKIEKQKKSVIERSQSQASHPRNKEELMKQRSKMMEYGKKKRQPETDCESQEKPAAGATAAQEATKETTQEHAQQIASEYQSPLVSQRNAHPDMSRKDSNQELMLRLALGQKKKVALTPAGSALLLARARLSDAGVKRQVPPRRSCCPCAPTPSCLAAAAMRVKIIDKL